MLARDKVIHRMLLTAKFSARNLRVGVVVRELAICVFQIDGWRTAHDEGLFARASASLHNIFVSANILTFQELQV